MKPQGSRQKGRNFEKQIAKILREKFNLTENDVTRSGIFGGEDIKFSREVGKTKTIGQFSIEAKKREKLDIWEAIEQCLRNSKGKKPLIIFSKNHKPTYVTLDLDIFLEMCYQLDKEIKNE